MPLPKFSDIFAKRAPKVEETADEPAKVEQPEAAVEEDPSSLAERSQETTSDPEAPVAGQGADQAAAELAKTAHKDQDTGVSAIGEADIEPETEPESEPESREEPMPTDSMGNQENSPAEPVQDGQTPSPEPIGEPGSLGDTLSEVFQTRRTRDPLIQALLDEHGQVDIQDLASDLRRLAGEVEAESN